eukprot:CAMPEP_0179097212 /NCGR_PEP_ID=MMETSP0796-20121207/44730_1 /TAXON_ID=73915 /ORGANISM="Pyrodinium bahamense, Strain pbaha01" /LENGTH=536 /DNA_ID=CAMNT_0020794949 /DNA_START=15 /DNA_END=1625 /DNA_ORIENTATION=+
MPRVAPGPWPLAGGEGAMSAVADPELPDFWSPGKDAREASGGPQRMLDLVRERCGEDFTRSMLRVWKEEALPTADRAKLAHFLSRGEESPQAPPFEKHKEDQEEHLVEFVCKLALYAPEEWYQVLSGIPRPDALRNDFKVIGVAFDASSRLRRCGIEHYHRKLTERMAGQNAQLAGFPETPYVFYVGAAGVREIRSATALPERPPAAARLVSVSDTHLLHERLRLPEGDILVHAGDVSYEESRSPDAKCFDEYRAGGRPLAGPEFLEWFTSSGLGLAGALDWLGSRPGFEHRLFIGGNHDYILEQLGPENAERLCKEKYGLTYLHTARPPLKLALRSCEASLSFWGSGVSFAAGLDPSRAVRSGNAAFQLDDACAAGFFDDLRDEAKHPGLAAGAVDVMVVHTPPQGRLLGKAGQGAEALGRFVGQLQPALYICGHSHHPGDPVKDVWADLDGVLGVNAACLGVWNQLHGLPVVVDLPLPVRGSAQTVAADALAAVTVAATPPAGEARPGAKRPVGAAAAAEPLLKRQANPRERVG